jgi:hypothetical protein
MKKIKEIKIQNFKAFQEEGFNEILLYTTPNWKSN